MPAVPPRETVWHVRISYAISAGTTKTMLDTSNKIKMALQKAASSSFP